MVDLSGGGSVVRRTAGAGPMTMEHNLGMRCPNCKRLTEPGRFCEHCGARLEAETEAIPDAPPRTGSGPSVTNASPAMATRPSRTGKRTEEGAARGRPSRRRRLRTALLAIMMVVVAGIAIFVVMAGTGRHQTPNRTGPAEGRNPDGRWLLDASPALPANAASSQTSSDPILPFATALNSVSCTSSSFCSVAGTYRSVSGGGLPLVDVRTRGRWGRSIQLTFGPGVSFGHDGEVSSLSCWTAVSCSAVGTYQAASNVEMGMVASESHGIWGQAEDISPPANVGSPVDEYLASVACTGPATCVAIGGYNDRSDSEQSMIVTESHGVWGQALQVALPPDARPNDQGTTLSAVACPAAGSCVVTGSYWTRSDLLQPMAVAESGGVWARAQALPLPPGASNVGANSHEVSERYLGLSCRAAGTCVAVGAYTDSHGDQRPMAVAEVNGRWRPATEIPLPSKAVRGAASAVACATETSCTVLGEYTDVPGSPGESYADYISDLRPMVVTLSGHTWARPASLPLPRDAAPKPGALLDSISCPGAGRCVAVGQYRDTSGQDRPLLEHQQA